MTIKPYNVSELCRLYDITDKTLSKWLRPFQSELGERIGNYYTVVQVKIIFSRIGAPCELMEG